MMKPTNMNNKDVQTRDVTSTGPEPRVSPLGRRSPMSFSKLVTIDVEGGSVKRKDKIFLLSLLPLSGRNINIP